MTWHADYDDAWLSAQAAKREAEQAALEDPACDACGVEARLTCCDRTGFWMCARCLTGDALLEVGACSACGETDALRKSPGVEHERLCPHCFDEEREHHAALEDADANDGRYHGDRFER